LILSKIIADGREFIGVKTVFENDKEMNPSMSIAFNE
jgi:hypothetical protein